MKILFRPFKAIEKDFLMKLLKNIYFFFDSHNGLRITNSICHKRTIVPTI